MKFVLLDYTHFKRKRSHKVERSLNCTEWKIRLKLFNANTSNLRFEIATFKLMIARKSKKEQPKGLLQLQAY